MKQETSHVWAPRLASVLPMGECGLGLRLTTNFFDSDFVGRSGNKKITISYKAIYKVFRNA